MTAAPRTLRRRLRAHPRATEKVRRRAKALLPNNPNSHRKPAVGAMPPGPDVALFWDRSLTDNSAALRRARHRDSTTKRHRAAETIQAMIEAGQPISFPAVARRANVSVALLYGHAELAGRISDARNRQRQAGAQRAWRLPARSLVTEQSLRADLANTREQARQLGRSSDPAGPAGPPPRHRGRHRPRPPHQPLIDQLEDRAAELEADNHRLRESVSQLQTELRQLTETLEAARAMNRELMNEINRSAPPHATARSPRHKT
jgi:DNA repair exonuclease SbcCD ATPase subunit